MAVRPRSACPLYSLSSPASIACRCPVLTDSTHGEMRAFELNTVRVRDADGIEGVGYTFTVGRNGGAIA